MNCFSQRSSNESSKREPPGGGIKTFHQVVACVIQIHFFLIVHLRPEKKTWFGWIFSFEKMSGRAEKKSPPFKSHGFLFDFLLIFRTFFLRFRRNRKKKVRKITPDGFFGRFFFDFSEISKKSPEKS